ncbi:hypothetical protein M408DRAFT_195405 [Serendipita vermifera MAFF 305830]|uniref:Uncharacterized protein n=1 Tax=Serendipita vermifera MAFF 305830 TaxID=933852 RepID=A0A0C2WIW6_SERVB|nr:hypothetical protein M408DRAFT_195405 [Serendipita vermifera MAFF 305830]
MKFAAKTLTNSSLGMPGGGRLLAVVTSSLSIEARTCNAHNVVMSKTNSILEPGVTSKHTMCRPMHNTYPHPPLTTTTGPHFHAHEISYFIRYHRGNQG